MISRIIQVKVGLSATALADSPSIKNRPSDLNLLLMIIIIICDFLFACSVVKSS